MPNRTVTIDLVTQRPDGAFVLVLVEQGPWTNADITSELRRLQDRLYDYVDAAVDGPVAERWPESKGKPVIIRLDCYDTPDEPVRKFFGDFAECIRKSEEVKRDIAADRFVTSIDFEYHWRTLQGHIE